jgi:hypothetical protein
VFGLLVHPVGRAEGGSVEGKEEKEMRRSLTMSVLLALSVSLLLAGVALAQDPEPMLPVPPDPPKAVEGVYVTTEDNAGNGGTSVADDDMGGDPTFIVCPPPMPKAPVEFYIVVDQEICSGGELALAVYDFATGQHEVYVNGQFVGYLPPQMQPQWDVALFPVPQAALKKGKNLVEVVLVGGDCGYIDWGALAVEPCEEEFVPEPGSMLLLGSGLMGLAGYATLRWRNRE